MRSIIIGIGEQRRDRACKWMYETQITMFIFTWGMLISILLHLYQSKCDREGETGSNRIRCLQQPAHINSSQYKPCAPKIQQAILNEMMRKIRVSKSSRKRRAFVYQNLSKKKNKLVEQGESERERRGCSENTQWTTHVHTHKYWQQNDFTIQNV